MQTFLEQVADKILSEHKDELSTICVITPNRRAALFLIKHFSSRIRQACWAPEIISMEDFVSRVGDVTISEPVELLLDLYQVYRDIEQQQAEPLEEFLKWAPMLIKDFNDIDAHIAEPEKLFANVLDLKRIEAWNPDGSPPSLFQKKYLKFFEKTQMYHDSLKQHLGKKRTAYQGLAYRWAAEALQQKKTTLPWKRIYFAGFSALNQAEEVIIKTLTRSGVAKSFWDADKYYLENKNHEAGMFLRKYREQMGALDFVGDHFSISTKKIHIYGVAKNVNQAKLAGNILSSFNAEHLQNHQSAVVLANEELLLPMMNSIPANIDKLNITMGYPLRKTSLYSFFDAVFQLHLTTQRMKTARAGQQSVFYHKDLLRFFSHPVTAILWSDVMPGTHAGALIKKIGRVKRPFLSFHALSEMSGVKEIFADRLGFLFEGIALNAGDSITAFEKLASMLDKAFRSRAQQDGLEIEQCSWFTDFESLYPVGTILRKLRSLTTENTEVNDFRLVFMLFQAMARETRLPLSGEPLNGLQIMGMLETRNLDFKNLIILSANEDILPASKGSSSLIPFDVKAQFGIPVFKEKDAIYAYHFYRLLQRAENIHIIYNTQARDLGSSEKSRFITQLQMEMPSWNPNIEISEKIIALPPARDEFIHDINIAKTDEILAKLEAINVKGFSPSTLSHYIRCSLFFYFNHIATITENEEVEETMEARTLGIVLHETLEQLYADQNLEGKIIQPEHIDRMLENMERVLQEKFDSQYNEGDITTGKNLLLTRVAARYLKNFLSHEKETLISHSKENKYITYLRSEEHLKATISIGQNGNAKDINLRGFADRIDQLDGATRIIDYKSGKVVKEELTFDDWSEVVEHAQQNKSFQLMMYALLYRQTHPGTQHIIPGIFSLRNVSSGLQTLNSPAGSEVINETAVSEFQKELEKLFLSIFDKDIPFQKTETLENCVNCSFDRVCNRQ
jgi:ATP-dependent helicase/nuclease subunit B